MIKKSANTTGSYVRIENLYFGIHPAIVDPKIDIDIYIILTEDFGIDNTNENKTEQNRTEYLHFPILDTKAPNIKQLGKIVDIIINLEKDKRVYIACKGGHGRSGTVAGAVLGKKYNLSYNSVIDILNREWRTQRNMDLIGAKFRKLGVPQTKVQKNTLKTYIKCLKS